jgi:hypothetical protein
MRAARIYDYTKAKTLEVLLSDLREAEFPEKGEMRTDVYRDKLELRVDQWILLTYRAVLLDRRCKQLAEKHTDWAIRDEKDPSSLNPIIEVVSPHSGFMVTASPVRLFDDVPLCVEVLEEWEAFLMELQSRLQRWEKLERTDVDDYVRKRIGKVEREHLGPGIDDETWRVADELRKEVCELLIDGQPKRELEAVRKAIAAAAKGNQ